MDKRSDLSGEIINLAEDNMEIVLSYKGKKYGKIFSFSGLTFFYDMLAAVSVGVNLGVDLDSSLDYVSHFIPLKGRGEIINLPRGIRIIDETYNSNPFSLEQSITRIKEHKDFLILIIGDMLELGENSQKLHEEAGEMLASVKPDIVVGFGEYASFLKKGATFKGLKKVFDFNDRTTVLNFLRSVAIPEKSIIFIKGSRGLKMEEFVEVFRERFYDGKN
jgi:UDP-N-acetylmuramoyl-tripeptide--D-alanyl-D-alanine ligase